MRKVLTVLVTIAVVLGLTACGGGSEKSDSVEQNESIKLGLSGPLTGTAAVYGIDCENAAKLAVKEINALEGKEYFALKVEDDVADPEKSPTVYGALKDWGMQISLFTVTSGAGAAVAADYYNDRIFALTPSGSNPLLVSDGNTNYDTNFQVCFSDPNQGIGAADYIADNKLGTKVGIIYRSDDQYSTSIYQTFLAEAKVKGLNIVAEQSFEGDTASDFSAQVKKCQEVGADIVFLPIYYTPASLILTEAKKDNYKPIFFGVDGLDGILTIEGFDTSLAEGCYLLTPFAADAKDEKTQNFVAAFKAAYGATPTQFAADTYDAVYAIYQACKAENITPDMATEDITNAMIKQFTSMTFDGLTGSCQWAVNGEVNKTPKAVIIKNGAYVSAE